ncbi:FecR family protein [Carboxylicivirga sp. RSCT41]|uniref:FecR family protein n=1 Tax=Carboxylicivirga agarovorans TaxID=3417570 RepID=UPI003D349BFA
MELTEDTLIKYIKEELPEEERLLVELQLKDNEEAFRKYMQLKDTWDYAALKTNVNDYNVSEEWTQLASTISFKRSRLIRFRQVAGVIGIAASLMLAFFIGNLFNSINQTELDLTSAHIFTAPEGQITTITLADGSEITLNEGSQLSVPIEFGKTNRKVNLNGEGYFKVSKNKDLVFSVISGKQEVKVLGTIFNIRAYANESRMITSLEEGVVRWELEDKHITLKPGMQVVYDSENSSIEQNQVDVNSVRQWALGRYMYQDAPFEEIISVIEKWYGVQVRWNAKEFEGKHFNGVIKRSSSLEETLSLISLMTPIDYTVKGEIVTIKRMR